ncbi:MAG: hypothetical protein AB7T49_01635 [Oligoflexales bacterium]
MAGASTEDVLRRVLREEQVPIFEELRDQAGRIERLEQNHAEKLHNLGSQQEELRRVLRNEHAPSIANLEESFHRFGIQQEEMKADISRILEVIMPLAKQSKS